MINKEDDITGQEVITIMKEFKECQKRVNDPTGEIKVIFDKIQAWKDKMGDKME